MVFVIGFGVVVLMIIFVVFCVVLGDLILWKLFKLFVLQIDMWGFKVYGKDNSELLDVMDYIDVMVLMWVYWVKYQLVLYQILLLVVLVDVSKYLINVSGYVVYSEFFLMVELLFKYGSGWIVQDDMQCVVVVVISSKFNEKLFGGENSLGCMINIEGKDYCVVGVFGDWNLQLCFYDIVNIGGFFSGIEDVFILFEWVIVVGMFNDGNINCNEILVELGFVGLQCFFCIWMVFLVQLDDVVVVQVYCEYFDGYVKDQQFVGCFGWVLNNCLCNIFDWFDLQYVVFSDIKVLLLVVFGLLVVCLVNMVGLLLVKFLCCSSEIGVCCVLGVRCSVIYVQFFIEVGIVGVVGGVFGLLFIGVGVVSVSWVLFKDIVVLVWIDLLLLVLILLVVVVVIVLVGFYFMFCVLCVQLVWQLKFN